MSVTDLLTEEWISYADEQLPESPAPNNALLP